MKHSRLTVFPFGLWMVLFTLIPLGMVVWFAFTDESGAFSLDNIREIGQYYSELLVFHLGRGAVHVFLPDPRLSARLQHLPHRRARAAHHGDDRDAADVDEFTAAHLPR